MTDEQFDKLFALLESMDWKLWETHNMIKDINTMMKNVLIDESEESNDNDN